MAEKTWGGEPFWGLGYEWDPEWVLTDRQRELRDLLIDLCEKEMRANAKEHVHFREAIPQTPDEEAALLGVEPVPPAALPV